MRIFRIIYIVAGLSCLPYAAFAEDAQTIMQKMEQEQVNRWSKLKSYVVVKDATGVKATRTVLLYEKIPGAANLGFRIVPPDEIAQRASGISDHQRQVVASAAFWTLAGLLPSTGDASIDGQVTGAVTDFFSGAAKGGEYNKTKAQQEAGKSAFDRKRFQQMAKWVALERFGDRWAHHLRAVDINETQSTPQGNYTLKTADLFVDNQKYVPLKMRFDFQEDKTGKMFSVEKISSNYKQAGPLYEPYKEIMRINPGLGGQQAAEFEKAQREMKKLKQQLDAMPPAQKAMMMQMMGPQMKTMEKMAAGKGIEVESNVIAIHPGGGIEEYLKAVLTAQANGP